MWRPPNTRVGPRAEQAVELAAWIPGVFWVVYSLSNTLLPGPPALGPVTAVNIFYLLMLPAAAGLIMRWRHVSVPGLATYGAFILWVLLSLAWRDPSSGVDVPKRMLIYGLLGLGAAQAVSHSRAAVAALAGAGLATAAVLTVWTLWSMVESGFQPRAGISVNPNYVATLIGVGVLAGLTWYFDRAQRGWRRTMLAGVLACSYALLLLGSRGVLLSLLPAAGIIWRRAHPTRGMRQALLVGVAVVAALAQFPGLVRCTLDPAVCGFEQKPESASASAPVPSGAPGPPHQDPDPARLPQALPVPGRPRVANTGEGQYGADLRYYRVRWLRDNGDGTFSQSEPGQPAAFQPSGAGLAVRVSRPEPPGAGETHWTIEQSANGRDWNRRGGDGQPIGREWLDDAWAVSAYPSERTRAAVLGRLGDWHPVSVRLSLWTSALIQLSSGARPLLIGGGMGESQVVSLREDPRYDSVHNAFLQVALDFGLIGLALVAVFHWHVLCALHAQSGWRSTLCLAGVVFWLGAGLTATVTDTHPYWLFLGVAAAQAAGARGAADPHIR